MLLQIKNLFSFAPLTLVNLVPFLNYVDAYRRTDATLGCLRSVDFVVLANLHGLVNVTSSHPILIIVYF